MLEDSAYWQHDGVDYDQLRESMETNWERVGTTREAREFAEVALQAEQTKMENGKSTSFFVLQFQRDLTAARSEERRSSSTAPIAAAEPPPMPL